MKQLTTIDKLISKQKNQPHWPKVPPSLSTEQQWAREQFILLWHEILENRYQMIERFNQEWVAKLPFDLKGKTLELGPGIGAFTKHQGKTNENYHCLELREAFCEKLRDFIPADRVHQGDIHKRQSWSSGLFDRIVAIHMLEHLVDLPKALCEIDRLLKSNGIFDLVIPCEGGLAYSLARKISGERVFKKHFKMDYLPIIQNEHVSTYYEIVNELKEFFVIDTQSFFPFKIPVSTLNLCVGFRLRKK